MDSEICGTREFTMTQCARKRAILICLIMFLSSVYDNRILGIIEMIVSREMILKGIDITEGCVTERALGNLSVKF